jgi:hypothetical protein
LPARMYESHRRAFADSLSALRGCRAASPGRQLEHARLGQPLKIIPPEADQFPVRASVKCDLLIARQAFVYESGHVVKISERWHGAGFTIREAGSEFRLGGQGNRRSPVRAAIPWAVYATEWEMTTYLMC